MRSLLGGLVDAIKPTNRGMADTSTPVPYAARGGLSPFTSAADRSNTVKQLSLMGEVGTLFGVVHRTTTSTAAVNWRLYKKAASGKKEDRTEVSSHAALDLWGDNGQVNEHFHRAEYVELIQQHIELTGKGFVILAILGGYPVEMWWARPDRMTPVPHPTKYLAGWIYQGPAGERVPLSVEEVIPLRMPDPIDPYGGMGPVQALLADLDSTRYAAEWNRNFFTNGAEPGGVVEVPEEMDDDEFKQFQSRWEEQHRGVARAHRVALLEGGAKWVTTSISQKDMQFVQLRTSSRDTIMEAYTIHKAELGIAEDVNRANAEAGEVIFAKRLTVPRLERWKAALNHRLLPMYGNTAKNLEFDYDSPVPEDEEAERAELTARVDAVVKLVAAGASWAGACDAVGFSQIEQVGVAGESTSPRQVAEMVQKLYLGVGTIITWEEGRQILVDAGAQLDVTLPAPDAPAPAANPFAVAARAERLDLPVPLTALEAPAGPEQVDHTDTQAAWVRLVDLLMASWATITVAQRTELLAQIRAAVDAGDLNALTGLSVDTADAEVLLAGYLDDMASEAAGKVVREAMAQGVDGMDPHVPPAGVLADLAKVTAGLVGSSLALAAGREAMRVQSAGMTGQQVADTVEGYLAELAPPRAELGGALTGAQNQARIETLRRGPEAALYADERMDGNTCPPCKEINGRWIGNTADGTVMDEVERLYPQGGYVNCLGRSRCRGTITGVWRPQTTKQDGE